MRRTVLIGAGLVALGVAGFALAAETALSPLEDLGKAIFFDQELSINRNQACAACHAPDVGFTGPDSEINAHGAVYEGSIPGRFGDRKPPASSYATLSPLLQYVTEKDDALFIGGNFWDGRATGARLGNAAADQAQGPFLNPMEQGLPDSACVVYRVCNPAFAYAVSFEEVWGPDACDILWPMDVDTVCSMEGMTVALSPEDRVRSNMAYDNIALSIAAYEGSTESNAFTSKYDYVAKGEAEFTRDEKMGFNLFRGKGKCAKCHVLDGGETPFTDFTYDNLGVPKNPENPIYNRIPDYVDLGLGGFLATQPELWASFAEDNYGKQKVPTLRNVAKAPDGVVKNFSHNGYFKSLEGIVHFYNTRDAKQPCLDPLTTEADALAMNCWPAAEVGENVNTEELGDLHLSPRQEAQIIEFLKTLSDGYTP